MDTLAGVHEYQFLQPECEYSIYYSAPDINTNIKTETERSNYLVISTLNLHLDLRAKSGPCVKNAFVSQCSVLARLNCPGITFSMHSFHCWSLLRSQFMAPRAHFTSLYHLWCCSMCYGQPELPTHAQCSRDHLQIHQDKAVTEDEWINKGRKEGNAVRLQKVKPKSAFFTLFITLWCLLQFFMALVRKTHPREASQRSVWLFFFSSTWQITRSLRWAVRIHLTAEHPRVHCVGIWAHLIVHRFPFSPFASCASGGSRPLFIPGRLDWLGVFSPRGSVLFLEIHRHHHSSFLIRAIYSSKFGAWNPRHWGSSCLSRLVSSPEASTSFACSSVSLISHTHLYTHARPVVLYGGGYCQGSNDVKRMCHLSRLESPRFISPLHHQRAVAFTPRAAVSVSALPLSCETDICSSAAHDTCSLFAVTLSAYLWG